MGKILKCKTDNEKYFLLVLAKLTPTVTRESEKREAKFILGNDVKLSS